MPSDEGSAAGAAALRRSALRRSAALGQMGADGRAGAICSVSQKRANTKSGATDPSRPMPVKPEKTHGKNLDVLPLGGPSEIVHARTLTPEAAKRSRRLLGGHDAHCTGITLLAY